MALRPTWRGHLRLALVSCPVRLTPATTSSSNIRFHKLNKKTGNRLRQQMIDAETGKVVERDETIMGYEFEKGRYVKVEPEEIDALKIESSEIITIERVVALSDVDPLFMENPYIVEPDDKSGLDIFATIREALQAKEVVGIGRIVLARREHPVMVQPRGKGFMLTTLHDPDEVRLPEEIFGDIKDVKVDKQNLQLAETLIERMEGRVRPEAVRGPLPGGAEGHGRSQDEGQEDHRTDRGRAALQRGQPVRGPEGQRRRGKRRRQTGGQEGDEDRRPEGRGEEDGTAQTGLSKRWVIILRPACKGRRAGSER